MNQQEAVVAQIDDLQNSEMKQVEVNGTKVLLARVDDQFHAVGARCTHYDAPLADGVLHGTQVMCPWHHACYSIVTGELQDAPALDALPRYPVRTDGDQVIVSVPADAPYKVVPPMAAADPTADDRVFVVLGAGPAGVAAAEVLRQAGFRGRVVLATREAQSYDRTILSKDYLQDHNDMGWIPMRSKDFYDEHGIELLTNHEAQTVDAAAQTIRFADGSTLHYDALLLATGSVPKSILVPGSDLENVFLLRTLDDCERIMAAMPNAQRAVVIGASWIGMEAASVLRTRGLHVTVVAPENVPFANIFGDEVGQMFRRLHEKNGVQFCLETNVEQIMGDDHVISVRLASGAVLPADMVIVGIGVRPMTDMLIGVPTKENGSVTVDQHLRVHGTNGTLFAAGDLATYPDPVSGDQIRIEHWRVAMQHGRAAARNMVGQAEPFDRVPLFWSLQHKQGFRYIGHAREWDEVLIDGDLDDPPFLVHYLKDGKLLAALGADRDKDIAAIETCLALNHLPAPEQFRGRAFDWAAWLAQAA